MEPRISLMLLVSKKLWSSERTWLYTSIRSSWFSEIIFHVFAELMHVVSQYYNLPCSNVLFSCEVDLLSVTCQVAPFALANFSLASFVQLSRHRPSQKG
jgi:hypothetical protein